MAVSVIANPVVYPEVISCSYPQIIEMTSTVYGAVGVSQFRYVAEVTTSGLVGKKYTVPTDPTASNGVFDMSEIFKLLLKLSHLQYGSTDEITKITGPWNQAEETNVLISVAIKEQYYVAGVYTVNSYGTLLFQVGRGFTDRVNGTGDPIWGVTNWYKYNGLANFIPYSGHARILYAQMTEDPDFVAKATNAYMKVELIWKYDTGVTITTDVYWVNRSALGQDKLVYVPLFKNLTSTLDNFGSVEVNISTAPTIGGAETLEETLYFEKNITTCVDDEAVIMFRDRFFSWSFMSFTKKQSTTVNTVNQQAESASGRFRYNVKASDVLTLNTDWMQDAQNEMLKDLVATEKAYLMSSDGSLEEVTVVPNSLRLQTSRNDGLHQYQMSFRKSVDNFKA